MPYVLYYILYYILYIVFIMYCIIYYITYCIMYYIISYSNNLILWDHRRMCGPSLTETSLCGAWLYLKFLIYSRILFWFIPRCVIFTNEVLQTQQKDIIYSFGLWFIIGQYHLLSFDFQFVFHKGSTLQGVKKWLVLLWNIWRKKWQIVTVSSQQYISY